MEQTLTDYSKQRTAFRLPMKTSESIYLLLSIDGEAVDPILDELGANGARFASTAHFDKFYEGQTLGPSVLVLPEIGMPIVYPVIRWVSYPRIGIEFHDIEGKDREVICRLMFAMERQIVRVEKTRTINDRLA
jgi:hypothetical protein